MGTYLGFDPGGYEGHGNFGWAVISGDRWPLSLVDRGIARHAQGAIEAVSSWMRNNEIDAVGIDAPLFWARAGDRAVDQELRNAIHQRGCPTPGGTVQSVNSLRGACLIQGMLVAMMCQEQIAHKFLITEAHPKALLWLLGKSTAGHGPNNIALTDLYGYIGDRAHGATDHERDAVLGALTAFAMHSRQFGWRDIYGLEAKPITTLNPPPSYWMPM